MVIPGRSPTTLACPWTLTGRRPWGIDRHTLLARASRSRRTLRATLPVMATKATTRKKSTATPWGAAVLVEQLTLPQRSGEKRFASVVQLLETDKGERFVRFAYTTGGTARRGPVTLRLRDLERLRAALAEHPGLAEALRLGEAAWRARVRADSTSDERMSAPSADPSRRSTACSG